MGGEDRGAAMAASLARAARSAGIGAEGVQRISIAHALAMAPRVATLDDDHHPVYLHPGRTVLVLLRDVDVTDPVLLAAAALVESEDAELQADLDAAASEMGSSVMELVRSVPASGSEALAETLVTAEADVRTLAIAERLDHLRHAHLRGDSEWRERVHAEAVAVYLPIAERTDERLAGRYRHWRRAFERRFKL